MVERACDFLVGLFGAFANRSGNDNRLTDLQEDFMQKVVARQAETEERLRARREGEEPRSHRPLEPD